MTGDYVTITQNISILIIVLKLSCVSGHEVGLAWVDSSLINLAQREWASVGLTKGVDETMGGLMARRLSSKVILTGWD
jgi:hypothetical protein